MKMNTGTNILFSLTGRIPESQGWCACWRMCPRGFQATAYDLIWDLAWGPLLLVTGPLIHSGRAQAVEAITYRSLCVQ